MTTQVLGGIILGASAVPLGFLAYTLVHLRKLGIPIWHPRVFVELGLFVLGAVIGLVYCLNA